MTQNIDFASNDNLVKDEMLRALALYESGDKIAAKKSIEFVVGYLIVKELEKMPVISPGGYPAV